MKIIARINTGKGPTRLALTKFNQSTISETRRLSTHSTKTSQIKLRKRMIPKEVGESKKVVLTPKFCFPLLTERRENCPPRCRNKKSSREIFKELGRDKKERRLWGRNSPSRYILYCTPDVQEVPLIVVVVILKLLILLG